MSEGNPPAALALPRRGLLDLHVTLRHFAITSFAVPVEGLARYLPPGFTPEVLVLAEGERALVSAVSFLDVGMRFRLMPWPRFTCGQTNYRAYVRHAGRRVAWFFATTLDSPLVLMPRLVWSMPWHRARMAFDVGWTGDRCERYLLRTTGAVGAVELDVEGSAEPTGSLEGFRDEDETRIVLTHPTEGFFTRRGGGVATYAIWHAPLTMQRARPTRARFQLFEDLGLVQPDTQPHSVLLQRETDYAIYLPPRRIAVAGP